MNKYGLSVALAAMLISAAGVASAQMPGWAAGPYYYGHHGHGMGPMFGVVDHNGNGVIEADEAAAAAEERHDAMDLDGDGVVSKDEFKTGHLRFGPGHGRRHQQLDSWTEQRFKEMDKNNDGVIDHGEHMDAAQQRFNTADTDKDGKVSPWEYRRHRHHQRG